MKKTMILILSVFAAGCFHDGKTEKKSAADSVSGSGEIVATVNGEEIFESRISVYAPAAGTTDREFILDNVISGEVISQAARAAEMHLRPEIAEQLRIAEQTVLGRAYTEEFLAANETSEATISLRYEELKSELSGRSEYRTAHILVGDEELAKQLHSQISADGETFAALAEEHSQDPGSAAQGGELGWADSGALVPEYAAAMQQTEPGNLVPAPVQTQFGWHIIRVDEKREVAPPPLNDDLRRNIVRAVQAELFSAHLQELLDGADIVRN